jgi:anti-sigma factor RsiW
MSIHHHPYEEWLLGSLDEALPAEQAAELEAHLHDCPACRALSDSWQLAEHTLRRAPLAAPRAGFSARWLQRVDVERQRSHRRQGLLIFGLNLLLAAGLLAGLMWLALPMLRSPDLLLWTWLYQMVRWLSVAGAARQFLGGFLSATAANVPLAAWVLFAGILSQLGVLWVVSYRVLTNPRRISQ